MAMPRASVLSKGSNGEELDKFLEFRNSLVSPLHDRIRALESENVRLKSEINILRSHNQELLERQRDKELPLNRLIASITQALQDYYRYVMVVPGSVLPSPPASAPSVTLPPPAALVLDKPHAGGVPCLTDASTNARRLMDQHVAEILEAGALQLVTTANGSNGSPRKRKADVLNNSHHEAERMRNLHALANAAIAEADMEVEGGANGVVQNGAPFKKSRQRTFQAEVDQVPEQVKQEVIRYWQREKQLPVVCNGQRGLLVLTATTPPVLGIRPAKGGPVTTPIQFEADSGLSNSKNWQQSIKAEGFTMNGLPDGPPMRMGHFTRIVGIPTAKGSISYGDVPHTTRSAATNGGRRHSGGLPDIVLRAHSLGEPGLTGDVLMGRNNANGHCRLVKEEGVGMSSDGSQSPPVSTEDGEEVVI